MVCAQVSMKKLARYSKTCRCKGIRTKVNVQEGCIGSLHQDLLRRTVKSLIHEVHPIPHHGLDLLCKGLKPTQKTSLPQFLRVPQFCLMSSPSTWPALHPRPSPESGTWTCTAWPTLYTWKNNTRAVSFCPSSASVMLQKGWS